MKLVIGVGQNAEKVALDPEILEPELPEKFAGQNEAALIAERAKVSAWLGRVVFERNELKGEFAQWLGISSMDLIRTNRAGKSTPQWKLETMLSVEGNYLRKKREIARAEANVVALEQYLLTIDMAARLLAARNSGG